MSSYRDDYENQMWAQYEKKRDKNRKLKEEIDNSKIK